MRAVLFILLLCAGGLSQAQAQCLCRITARGNSVVLLNAASEAECRDQHVLPYLGMNKFLDSCLEHTKVLDIQWGCTEKAGDPLPHMSYAECRDAGREATENLLSAISTIPGLNRGLSAPAAHECKPESLAAKTEFLNAKKIRLSFDSKEELEKTIMAIVPGGVLDRPLRDWEFSYRLRNDNGGYGLLDRIFSDGNDFGYTHGVKMSVSKGVGEGYHLTLEYSSDLYTKKDQVERVDGIRHADQFFLEENLLKLLVDTKDKGSPVYVSAGLGWHQLNNESLGNLITSAAAQQYEFHETVNSIRPGTVYDFAYQGRGMKKNGVYGEAAVGVEGSEILSRATRWKVFSEAGVSASSLNSAATQFRAEAGTSLDYQPNHRSYATRAGATVGARKYRSSPTQFERSIFVELGKERFKCGTKFTLRSQKKGSAYRDFDLDKDPILDMYCNSQF